MRFTPLIISITIHWFLISRSLNSSLHRVRYDNFTSFDYANNKHHLSFPYMIIWVTKLRITFVSIFFSRASFVAKQLPYVAIFRRRRLSLNAGSFSQGSEFQNTKILTLIEGCHDITFFPHPCRYTHAEKKEKKTCTQMLSCSFMTDGPRNLIFFFVCHLFSASLYLRGLFIVTVNLSLSPYLC